MVIAYSDDDYNRQREARRRNGEDRSRRGRDKGPLPPVADVARRTAAADSFRTFCETYFEPAFCLGWSPNHLRAIERIQESVTRGALYAFAMPRGSGKTTLVRVAALWAILNGYRRWVFLVGSAAEHATDLLRSCKLDLSFNRLLIEDYPETVYLASCLENTGRMAGGQLCDGRPTSVVWEVDEITLPTVAAESLKPGMERNGCGAKITVAGITGNIRGAQSSLPDGSVIRPDLVILDDPQTTESAFSDTQTRRRLSLLNGDILGLAGPGRKISGFLPCTVIRRGDLADQVLDRTLAPEWRGERMAMLQGWPDRMDLWDQYALLRADSFRTEGLGEPATEFYRRNREAMDAGVEATWPERFDACSEESAVQHAMNLYFRDQASFQSEYQNDPMASESDAALDPRAIASKTGPDARGVVPPDSHFLTASIDVQGDLLYWAVSAWRDDFTGQVIAYGAYPDQRTPNFRMANARRKLSDVYKGMSFEGALRSGLDACVAEIVGAGWKTSSGGSVELRRVLIDANWGQSTDLVFDMARASPHKSLVMPSAGRGIGAKQRPISDYTRQADTQIGRNWLIRRIAARQMQSVLFDSNWWKSFLMARLASPRGESGCLLLHKATAAYHENFASHLTAEYRDVVSANGGRTVDEWSLKPDRPDNHWLDCMVGCCVAASMCGARLASEMQEAPKKKKRGSGVAYL